MTPGTDWRDLKDEFRSCGEVTYADVRGEEGIVEFNSEDDRLKCIKPGGKPKSADGSRRRGAAASSVKL